MKLRRSREPEFIQEANKAHETRSAVFGGRPERTTPNHVISRNLTRARNNKLGNYVMKKRRENHIKKSKAIVINMS